MPTDVRRRRARLATRLCAAALAAWALAGAGTQCAQASQDAGVTVTAPTMEAQVAQDAREGPPQDAGESAPEPAGKGAEDGPENARESPVGGSNEPDDESAAEAGAQGSDESSAQVADAFDVTATEDGIAVHVAEGPGEANVTLELAPGVKTAPGVYAHGAGLTLVRPEVKDGIVVLHLSLDRPQGGTDVQVDLSGCSEDGTLVTRARAEGTSGEELGSCEEVFAKPIAFAVATMAATEPFRADGYFENTSSPTEHRIPTLVNARTGGVAFCNDMMLNAPGDAQHGSTAAVWYRSWQFPADPAEAAAQGQNYLDFIMFWGYPTDPTVGGRCSEADARAATQWALWHFTNEGSHPTWEAPAQAWSAGFWDAYNFLVAGADEYHAHCMAQGARQQPEYGCCQVWETDDAALQSILTAAPAYGWVRLGKSSTRPDLVGTRGYALAGATFEARAADGSVAATLVTDDAGTAEAMLRVGTYTLVETQAPAGHEVCGPIGFTVTGGPVRVGVAAQDPAVLGALTVAKHAGTDAGPALAAAQFQVIDAAGSVVATLVTGQDGTASTQDASLPLGTYTLRETAAPDGCAAAPDITFDITPERRRVEVSVTDPYDTTIEVVKLDAGTKEPLAGASLELVSEQGRVMTSWTSTLEPQPIRALAPGRYFLREKTAPAGYERADDVAFDVRLTSEVQRVTMEDVRARVPFSFTKTNALTGTPLAGATFSLHSPTRALPQAVSQEDISDATLWNEVGSATSGTDGTVSFGSLEEGTYLLLEDEAPDGYVRPTGGWLVRAGSTDGISVEGVGDAPGSAMTQTTHGLTLPNAPRGELPRAGGSGPGPLPAAGVAMAGAGALAGVRAMRRRAARAARAD